MLKRLFWKYLGKHPNLLQTSNYICKGVHMAWYVSFLATIHIWEDLRAATNKSQKTRNKNQETKRCSTFAVSRLHHS